jgi:hypothetical protein
LTVLPYAGTLRAEGRVDGMQALTESALEARFGPLDAPLRAALRRADEATLRALIILPPTVTLESVRAHLGLA